MNFPAQTPRNKSTVNKGQKLRTADLKAASSPHCVREELEVNDRYPPTVQDNDEHPYKVHSRKAAPAVGNPPRMNLVHHETLSCRDRERIFSRCGGPIPLQSTRESNKRYTKSYQ